MRFLQPKKGIPKARAGFIPLITEIRLSRMHTFSRTRFLRFLRTYITRKYADQHLLQTSRCRLKSQCPSVTSHQTWTPLNNIPRNMQVTASARHVKIKYRKMYAKHAVKTRIPNHIVITCWGSGRHSSKR